MLGSGPLQNLSGAVTNEIQRLRNYDWKGFAAGMTDTVVRGIMAGLSARELRAILRGDVPTEKPNPRYKAQVSSFMLHLRPKYYQRASTWFTHTWRLGWFSLYFFVVETITGIVLMLFYAPTPERAYGDMLSILGNVPYGKFMRDLHRLGAEGMVAAVVLHMVRVFFTASYKGPRKFTWFTGSILLVVTLFLSFSGYLLPWDQLAYWAVTIGTSMAEAAPFIGTEVNLLLRGAIDIWAGGLMRFYLLHVLLLPLVAIILISLHYYKVARTHSISLPAHIEEGENVDPALKRHAEERIDLLPNLMAHELMLTSIGTFIMVLACATFFEAPLEAHADPQRTPLHTKAPWYFLWLQGMLKLGDKQLMGVVLPTVIFGVIFFLPWIDQNPHRLPKKRKFAIVMGVLFTIMMVVMTYMGTPKYAIETPPAQDILSEFVPATDPGPVRELPYDEIKTGPDGTLKTYFVSYPPEWEKDPKYADRSKYEFITKVEGEAEDEFHEVLQHFKAKTESAPKLIQPVEGAAGNLPLAQVTVQQIQPDLKWVVMKIYWDEFVIDPKTQELVMIEDPATGVTRNKLKRDTKATPLPDEQVVVVAIHKDAAYGQH